jgi:hypothetical protein
MRNVSDKSCGENTNTHFGSVTFISFRKSCRLRENVEKYSIAGQATDDDVAHALCVTDT